jgi:hypothetical protein
LFIFMNLSWFGFYGLVELAVPICSARWISLINPLSKPHAAGIPPGQ